MRVLILGGEGMLGHKVFQILSGRFETFATFLDPSGPWTTFPMYQDRSKTIPGVNVSDFDTVVRAVAQVRPDAVVNAIGIIKQLREASDPIIAISINSLFPHRLADLCQAAGARLFHMSTDCVFTGNKGNYTEDDPSDAEDLYGRTKLLGELNRPGAVTIRTSIFGRDFLKASAMLEWFLSNRGGKVRGYKNAIYTGFTTQAMARIIGDIIERHPDLSGLWQVASEPISKFDLLTRIRDAMKLPIEIEPFDDPPCDRSLSAAKFLAATGCRLPSWDEMVAELAADPTPYDDWRRRHEAARR